ncbi:bifunctional YncE family protein/alkaline phosphatase family protein [Paludibaculum fermentans]|uniref:Bifunctional YncE family protein/alkaline phosphatase family protein n=1 Tax=Paludibaculum fermentans TaxID=1473598 RepID=A0A7S7NST1_PALFE|nr:bifunctional YncE family protein/alkaline phosphatase family protein [Paludibaculum fermentans]QOY89127.1 bifunctional YncE family protein/alkaline phosphatase family protein [Paludibaculum fermentans]
MKLGYWLAAGGLCLAGAALVTAEKTGVFAVLSSTVRGGKQPGGVYLIPTTQLLQPWGDPVTIAGRPVDLAFDPEKRVLAVLNTKGVVFFDPTAMSLLGETKSKSTSYAGLAFRPGTREVWASETLRNGPDGLLIITLDDRGAPTKEERVELKPHPLPIGIAFSKDGATAYVAFSRNNTLAEIDAATRQVKREIPVGIAPFHVALEPRSGRIFVANRGGRRPKEGDVLAPSSGSKIASDPVTGSSISGTLTVIDPDGSQPREVAVGLAPSGLALRGDGKELAVANGHSDSVTLVDTATLKTREVRIPSYPDGTRGSIPTNAAYAPDGQTLYVLCGGTNSVAVVRKNKVEGALPTGWFPSGIAIDAAGKLRVVSIKGTGNTALPGGNFNSRAYEGLIQSMPAPDKAQWLAGLREVKAANQPKFTPAGGVENLRSLGIQHVFFIIKENRTYDQVFGDIAKANGDPKLAIYGGDVTPNHHALAERYVVLDNFLTSSSISFDGHQWLMMAFVSDYTQRAFAASPRGYAWDMSDALTVSPAGFFFQGAPPDVKVRIFGEFCLPGKFDPATQQAEDIHERAGMSWSYYWDLYKTGKWRDQVGCSAAGLPALKPLMSPSYPQDDTVITDQIRAEEFLRELGEREKSGEMPNINILTMTSDHTNGTRPGSPTPKAMVADDDLALGRIVEGISKSRFWAHSLILVVEDDAQDGLDHVDGHRTVALAIGPNIRRGVVDSNHYNQISMVKTIQELFQIPPRTVFLQNSRTMTSVFTPESNLEPYTAIPNRIPLDQMNPPLKALNGRKLWAAQQSAAMNWEDVDDIPSDVLNKILWWDAKGYDQPYPVLKTQARR